jgi:hypothetical protein
MPPLRRTVIALVKNISEKTTNPFSNSLKDVCTALAFAKIIYWSK